MKYEKGTFIIIPNKERLKGKPSEMQTIFMWLCNYSDDRGSCFPSRRRLSKECGCNIKTVDKYLQQLIDDGFIRKELRKANGTKQNLSNMYTILLMDDELEEITISYPERAVAEVSSKIRPYVENGATVEKDVPYPSVENGSVTQSILTQTFNSITTNVVEDQKSTIGKLPDTFGKTYIMRLHYIYRYLWKKKYGTRLVGTANIGSFGRVMKTLAEQFSEEQIAILLLTYFNWYGGSGDNQKDNKYLSDNGFPAYLMVNKIDIFIAYLTNNMGLCYTDDTKVHEYFIKHFKELL